MTKELQYGIPIRENQVRKWLDSKKFKGEYLLVSTKPDSIYSKKLAELKTNQKLVVDLYTPIFLEKELTEGDVSVFSTGAGKATSNKQQATTSGERKVVLWFGGIYPWMDPEPLVEAFGKLASEFPNWKLRFLGGWHPDTGYGERFNKLKQLAKISIPDGQVEFVPWQSEKDLGKYFRDVAFAVHLPKQTTEDYYAHRVRLLTLLEVGIPVITGGRDMVSDLIAVQEVGVKIHSQEDLTRILSQVMSYPQMLSKWKSSTKKIQDIFFDKERDLIELRNT